MKFGIRTKLYSIFSDVIVPILDLYESMLLINHYNHYFAYVFFELISGVKSFGTDWELIHCNDLDTLLVGAYFKKTKKCRLVYDAHEFWPDSLIKHNKLFVYYLKCFEKGIVIISDVVITVSPQLVKVIEKIYNINNVKFLPNVEIYKENRMANKSKIRKYSKKRIIFLFQGGFTESRGLEELIDNWKYINSSKALLVMRGRTNDFLRILRIRARKLIKNKAVIFASPVSENNLVNAAMEADVGIIPYQPSNLNNKYCCPNKLSQYMQAGLAILSNNLPYVKGVIRKYRNGLSYDSGRSLIDCVNHFINDESHLLKMKVNSKMAGEKTYNWQFYENRFIRIYTELLRKI